MSSGELRFLVEIQSQSSASSPNGDKSQPSWTKFASAWASIISKSGREISDGRDATLGKSTIKIRYRGDITNKMRVVYDGIIYDIEDNYGLMGRRKYLVMDCTVVNK